MSDHPDGGRLAAKYLRARGIDCVFTLQSAGMAPYYEGCVAEGIRIIGFRHEQAAVMAADAWARITRKPGVALVDAGPGFGNAYTGLVNAYLAGSPVLCIGRGVSPLVDFDRGQIMELPVGCCDLARPITKWAKVCYEAARIPEYLDAALRHAVAGVPGPAYFECPSDIVAQPVPHTVDIDRLLTGGDPSAPAGHADAIAEAARLLEGARRPIIIAGSEMYWSKAPDGLDALARSAGIPVFLNGAARGALARDHPLRFAGARRAAIGRADVVLLVGATLDFRLAFGQAPTWPDDVAVVQVHSDQTQIGRNRPAHIGIVGDPGVVLGQLTDALRAAPPAPPEWVAELREIECARDERLAAISESAVLPMHPMRFVREIRDAVADRNPIVVVDGGFAANFSSQMITPDALGDWLDPGPMGCLGVGVPFAIGAKLAAPHREVLLITGDGAFGLNCMEFDTMVRYGISVACVVANNGCWGQDKFPPFWRDGPIACDLSRDTRYDLLAESLGACGERVADPDELAKAVTRALDADAPYCVDVEVSDDGANYLDVRGGQRGLLHQMKLARSSP